MQTALKDTQDEILVAETIPDGNVVAKTEPTPNEVEETPAQEGAQSSTKRTRALR